jgi:TolB-like protein
LEALAAPAALSGPGTQPASAVQPGPRPPTRLIVLPFRILRRHESSDFLAVSLPDAITSSLGAIISLVVRSSAVASRFTGPGALDVKKIAEETQVDAILTGTLISDGERLQVNAQLVEASDGALLWSHTSKMPVRDVFQLQDDLVDRIVQSLALPLTSREQRALKHDVPGNALAYELYLRAGQVAAGYGTENMTLARDLYLRSLEADPRYAPAWACLGRIYRIIGKYGIGDLAENLSLAEDAFQKSFALNPDLALAHNYYTALQTDLGRSLEAVERLLKRAIAHHNDPNLFAGLVHACRYSGLLEASAAAHQLAERLDPNIRTTVPYAYHYLGEFQKAFECCRHGDEFVKAASLVALGRASEALALLLEMEKSPESVPQVHLWVVSLRAFLEGDRSKSLEALNHALALDGPLGRDAEGCLWIAHDFANLNQTDRALDLVSRALDQGYRCHHALVHDPWLEALRSHPRFTGLLERATTLDRRARAVFRENSGARVLEMPAVLGEGQRTDSGDTGH